MQPGDLVSYWQMQGTRSNRVEGHGTLVRIRGNRATISTADGTVRVHVGTLTLEPTADQIRQRCEIIQAGWDEAERERRGHHYASDWNRASPSVDTPLLTVPTIRVSELLDSLAS